MDVNKGPSVEETQFGFPSPSQRKRVLHFASGETLEEDSSGEEDKETHSDVHSGPVNTSQQSWKMYSVLLWRQFCKKSLQTCDYLGEKLASLAGLNTSKYQYAVDEYHRKNKERNTDYGSMGRAGGAAHLKSDRSAGLRAEESADAAHLQHGH
ncbi:protein FAM177A1 isoform X2 [Scleropages formosus]|uniref:protein FAM177A1 isoform X2 n=1 Tax=Scleropages formosus TaxID=113540 RepID=UPI000878E656|nr:protein FAM177B isoform X2 [Scleropages formosus]